ncbi:MAG: DUF3141 domain-containing protein [Alphaproteobacteria bacterium]|nr:DUF3141 domain-containing protein [Alphaproteobacteria bacterium]
MTTTGSPYAMDPVALGQKAVEYWIDFVQRSILFADVMRQRGNIHFEHQNAETPTVLHFKYEMLLDGRKFVHPVNYHLVRILALDGTQPDPKKRPFIVFDPRAGHGPGIGGMKPDSEIGNAIQEGHPCYFVGFLPDPMPGQTVEHVCEAEAIFIARVIELHPDAEKPCLIGNCQAGWQIAMTGAIYPELVGVMILAGAPLSYWGGVRGKYPLRYSGGLVGGAWLTAFMSDIGNGKFDGAALVTNFENMNPANTFWQKSHNLYAKVDTEAPRFLDFERWWGSPVNLNREEINFIVNALFIGNRLSAARLRTSEGLRIDIRNIKAPILVFCSQGDDITPPQQALDWITDIYRTDDEIIAAGQTIVYCMHQKIGHLGIFVSGSVATKEHSKFIQNIDLIETLPPGLYEAVFVEKTEETQHAELAGGKYILKFENRTLDDIRKIGHNNVEDDRCFLTAKRVSENMLALYDSYVSPWVRAAVTEQSAELLRQMHPIRVRFGMFSDQNPFMAGVQKFAEIVRANRRPVEPDNGFWRLQEVISSNIVSAWDSYKMVKETFTEYAFFELYGARFLQSALGLRRSDVYSRSAGRDVDRERGIRRRMQKLMNLADKGGLPEALARAILYVVRGGGGFDEREFKMLEQLCSASTVLPKMSRFEFKRLLRLQHEILILDETNAMESLSKLLDSVTDAAVQESLSAIHTVINAHGRFTEEEKRRLRKLETYFVPSHTSPRRRASDVEVFGQHLE